MATSRPSLCSFLMYSSLSLGVACARKSSTPASLAMAAAVSGLSPVIITERMPMARKLSDALLHAALHDVLQMDHSENAFSIGDGQRRSAGSRNPIGHLDQIGRNNSVLLLHELGNGFRGAFAQGVVRPDPRRSCACTPRRE